jgi:hypothetical protein
MAAPPALRAAAPRCHSFATARCAAFTWVWVGRRKRRSGAKTDPFDVTPAPRLVALSGKTASVPRPASDVTSTCHPACEVNAAEAQSTEEPAHPCPLCPAARLTDTRNGSIPPPPFLHHDAAALLEQIDYWVTQELTRW